MKKLFCLMIMAVMLSVGALQAHAAANYPTRAVTMVVPFAPGGIGDVSARILAEALQKDFGQPIIVVNRTGAGGITGLNSVLRDKPDGYTIAAGSPGSAFAATLFTGAPRYDLDTIAFVAAYLFQDRVFIAGPNTPYKTWQEFVAFAKANPGTVSFGSSASQETMETIRAAAIKDGIDLRFVMYGGGGEAATDLLGGHVDTIETGVGAPGFQAARRGQATILANIGFNEEVPFFENIPRLTDLGYDFASGVVFGFAFPGKTPEPIRARWEQAIEKVLKDPEVLEKMENIGIRPRFMGGADYKEFSKKFVANMEAMLEFNQKATKK